MEVHLLRICCRRWMLADRPFISVQIKAFNKQQEFRNSIGHPLDSLVPHISVRPRFTFFHLGDRDAIFFINELMFNHTECVDHLHKINGMSSPLYTFGVLQSPDHILFVCQNFDSLIRQTMLRKLSSFGLPSLIMLDILRSQNLAAFSSSIYKT